MSSTSLPHADVPAPASASASEIDEHPMRFFRGVLFGVTFSSLFWALVAGLFLID